MPVTAPPLKATSSAGAMPPRAASATRELARTETFMPMKPAAAENDAADEEADRGPDVERDRDHDREHHGDAGDDRVLARQVGRRALLDGLGDLLHPLVAGRLAQQPAGCHESVDHRRRAQTSATMIP